MNTELFIAKRFIKNQKGSRTHTLPIIRLSVAAIALSLAVLIISVSVITGFKKEIRNRIIGFGGHIQILNLDSNNSLESSPINKNQYFLEILKTNQGIKSIQVFATKPGMIKTQNTNQGIIFKGIGSDFDSSFFKQNLIEGSIPKINDSIKSNNILISKKLATILNLKLKDKFLTYFIDERSTSHPINKRVFTIIGIYETSLEQFDEQFIFGDIAHVQTLNDWSEQQIGGFEILLNNFNDIEDLTDFVSEHVETIFMEDGSRLQVTNIKESNQTIFNWLKLLDVNIKVILLIMVFVAILNMVSGLIILILDRTPSIGLLKAVGTSNPSMMKIFLYQSGYLIIKGLIWGNVIALSLMLLQDQFHILKLNKTSYFLDYAPINFNVIHILAINLGTLIIVFIFMVLPSIIVTKIEPVKTLRYS